jgi:hypothetical protein
MFSSEGRQRESLKGPETPPGGDEDRNLKGPAASKRGKPISRIFETLSTGSMPTRRVSPRKAEGGRARVASWWVSCSKQHAELPHAVVRSGVATERPSFGKGNAPGRMNPRRARDAAREEIRRRCAPTDEGLKPLKRGRLRGNASCA